MTKDEALKMAIAEIEGWIDHAYGHTPEECADNKAIQACKEALEQPTMTYEQGFAHGYEAHRVEQEPLNLNCKSVQKRLATQWGYIEQPAQEPIEWMKNALDNARDVCKYLDHDMIKEAKAHTEFFWNDIDKIRDFDDTHPAPSWQGLSDDEIQKFMVNKITDYEFARAIEQALKEKNT